MVVGLVRPQSKLKVRCPSGHVAEHSSLESGLQGLLPLERRSRLQGGEPQTSSSQSVFRTKVRLYRLFGVISRDDPSCSLPVNPSSNLPVTPSRRVSKASLRCSAKEAADRAQVDDRSPCLAGLRDRSRTWSGTTGQASWVTPWDVWAYRVSDRMILSVHPGRVDRPVGVASVERRKGDAQT